MPLADFAYCRTDPRVFKIFAKLDGTTTCAFDSIEGSVRSRLRLTVPPWYEGLPVDPAIPITLPDTSAASPAVPAPDEVADPKTLLGIIHLEPPNPGVPSEHAAPMTLDSIEVTGAPAPEEPAVPYAPAATTVTAD